MESDAKIEDYREAAKIHRGIAILYLLFILICSYMMIVKSGDWGILVIFFGLVSTIHFSAFYGLNRNKTWAKVLSAIVAFGLLFGFPIGTILGGAILYYMFRRPRKQVNTPMQPTADAPAD